MDSQTNCRFGVTDELDSLKRLSSEVNQLAISKRKNYMGYSKTVPPTMEKIVVVLDELEAHLGALLHEMTSSPVPSDVLLRVDGRGGWRVFVIIARRVLTEALTMISRLPFFKSDQESTQQFLQRKLQTKISVSRLKELLDPLHTITTALKFMVFVRLHV